MTRLFRDPVSRAWVRSFPNAAPPPLVVMGLVPRGGIPFTRRGAVKRGPSEVFVPLAGSAASGEEVRVPEAGDPPSVELVFQTMTPISGLVLPGRFTEVDEVVTMGA